MADSRVLSLLERIVPFGFLRGGERNRIAAGLTLENYAPGQAIPREGANGDFDVYLIESGSVESVEAGRGQAVRVSITEEGHFFGEREALLGMPRRAAYRALGEVAVYRLARGDFLSLFRFKAFALAFGGILRERQGIFSAFERFKAELRRGISRGYVNIAQLLPLYKALEPALHPRANEPDKLDLSALMYAVRRLPDNVTRTFAYLLVDELPPVFSKPDKFFVPVETAARRRSIWEMLPGKSLVVLRNGFSDITDLVTCLCLYAVEVRKIRLRLQDTELLSSLDLLRGELAGESNLDKIAAAIAERLPFDRAEADGLAAVWEAGAVERLYDLVRHREIFNIDVRRQTNLYNSRRSELWTHQIGAAARELLGHEPASLPEDFRVHIVSSNTHSVINCLNPLLVEESRRILDWGARSGHQLRKADWPNDADLVYALLRDYLPGHESFAGECRRREREWGIMRLSDTPQTGVQVQLIDAARLAGLSIDSGVAPVRAGRKDVIVNIDYAFGEQAEYIIQTLLNLFGANVASVSLLGKAGALLGYRGDVLVPNAFIKQSSERYLLLPKPRARCTECLMGRLPGRAVHEGPMLTVDGTLLQNRMMLEFYRRVWGCIGLEMEGAHYFRRVYEARHLGIIPSDVDLRFYYYVSDLPLDHDSNLSTRMGAVEGIPPLYAITREILSEIFG